MGWLNGQVSPEGRLLGVTVKNGEQESSTKNCISFGVQMTSVGTEGRVSRLSTGEDETCSNSAPSSQRCMDRGVAPRRAGSVKYLWRPVLHDIGLTAGLATAGYKFCCPAARTLAIGPGFVVSGSWILASRMPYWKFSGPQDCWRQGYRLSDIAENAGSRRPGARSPTQMNRVEPADTSEARADI